MDTMQLSAPTAMVVPDVFVAPVPSDVGAIDPDHATQVSCSADLLLANCNARVAQLRLNSHKPVHVLLRRNRNLLLSYLNSYEKV